jgi:prephenate dehydrogenase
MDTLVVGAGRMGRWLGRTLDAAGHAVTYADSDPAVAAAAAGELRQATDDVDADPPGAVAPVDGDSTHDLVCIAVPMPAVPDAVRAQAGRAESALCDLGGAMGPAVAAAREAAPDRERASYHPLFSPANAPGRVAAVTDRAGEATAAVETALTDAGNHLFETDVDTHDRAMETVQARAHAAVLSFALAAEPVPEPFETPVTDALRAAVADVVGGDPRVYADVQATFDGADSVARAARRVADADREAFADLYAEATASADAPDGEGP